jgi:hypothetical protein
MADQASTFKNTLLFGPIIPKDYNLIPAIKNITDAIQNMKDPIKNVTGLTKACRENIITDPFRKMLEQSLDNLSKDEQEILFTDFILDPNHNFYLSYKQIQKIDQAKYLITPPIQQNYWVLIRERDASTPLYYMKSKLIDLIYPYLLEQIEINDKPLYKIEESKRINQYIPFINNCRDTKLVDFINSDAMQKIPYEVFLIPNRSSVIPICTFTTPPPQPTSDNSEPESIDTELTLATYILKYNKKTKKNPKLYKDYLSSIHQFTDSRNCPFSWYKNSSNHTCLNNSMAVFAETDRETFSAGTRHRRRRKSRTTRRQQINNKYSRKMRYNR